MSTTVAVDEEGKVCMVVWDQPQVRNIDATPFYRLNLVSFKVVTDQKWSQIIGAYLLPSTLELVLYLEEALTRFRYQDTTVVGYLSANIRKVQNPCSQQVADLLMEFRLMELLHLPQRGRFRHVKTSSRVIQGRLV